MIFKIILVFIGGLLSIVSLYAYDTYIDNEKLKLEIEKLKNLRKDNKNE